MLLDWRRAGVLIFTIFVAGLAASEEAPLPQETPQGHVKEPWGLFDDVTASATTQVGYDYWDVRTSTTSALLRTRLFLADSTPQWDYTRLSPWLKFAGHVRINSSLSATAKVRGDQSSGTRLDELSLDWGLSPFLGARAGVLDYKTSWCRTHDLDSPWVRENDPFCTVRTTDQATGAAPGLQVYTRTQVAAYQLQAIAGVFRPLAFGYDDQEFTNITLRPGSRVFKNRKSVVAVNLINAETGTEFRLSQQNTNQAAYYVPKKDDGPPYERPQRANLWYAAASFYATPKLNVRASYLKSDLGADCLTYPGDDSRRFDFCNITLSKGSKTLELAYQASAKDVVALAYSSYFFNQGSEEVKPTEILRAPGTLLFKNRSTSLAWRHDWRKGFYTALQVSHARMHQQTRTKYLPEPPNASPLQNPCKPHERWRSGVNPDGQNSQIDIQ